MIGGWAVWEGASKNEIIGGHAWSSRIEEVLQQLNFGNPVFYNDVFRFISNDSFYVIDFFYFTICEFVYNNVDVFIVFFFCILFLFVIF